MQSDLMTVISAINMRWLKLQSVIEERAADPSMWHEPGGRTGLLMKRITVLGSGPCSRVVEEYSVDCGLLAEMRALEQLAASSLANYEAMQGVIRTVSDITPKPSDWSSIEEMKSQGLQRA